jgi:hypothetical protein
MWIFESTQKSPKHGISRLFMIGENYDKNIIYLPRHSSFTINHTFANLGKTGQNVPGSLEITTV